MTKLAELQNKLRKVAVDTDSQEIGTLWDGTIIKFVHAEDVRNNFDPDFSLGGHGYVYDYIPENEIWIERTRDVKDILADTFHEIMEYSIMKYFGVDYETAHLIATDLEMNIRKTDAEVDTGV
jgi:hypothetical protein